MNPKPLALMTTIVSLLLLGFVGNRSEAFTIEEMRSRDGSYTYFYGGYTQHNAYVKTSEAYSQVKWYVDGVLRDTTDGDENATEDWFSPDLVSGSISGTTYEIKAVAVSWQGAETASDSYTITVYEPKIDSGTGTNTGVWGIAKLSRQYYSHPNITMVGSVYASNDTGRRYTGFARFKHHVDGPGVHLRTERDKPERSFSGNGGTYGSYSESISHSIQNGTSRKSYTSWAYIRLKASGHNANNIAVEDDWFVRNSVSFTRQ